MNEIIPENVLECLRKDSASDLEKNLQDTTKDYRREMLINNDFSLLWVVAGEKSVGILEYLLNECDAEVDFPHKEPESCYKIARQTVYKIGPTPLLHAIFRKKRENIKLLVEHGANVNATVDKFGNSLPPCLLHACREECYDKEIVKNLIDNGANVNLRNHKGLTALHYAARAGNTDCIQMLLENMAEYYWHDYVDVLPYAGFYGQEEIIEFLIEKTTQPIGVIADAYEMLGAHAYLPVSYADSLQMGRIIGLRKWQKAMKIRYTDMRNPILKKSPEDRKNVFRFKKEPQTHEELQKVDPVDFRVQSLLIYERILGESNGDFIRILAQPIWRGGNRLCELEYALSLCLKHNLSGQTMMACLDEITRGCVNIFECNDITLKLLELLGEALTPGTSMHAKFVKKEYLIMTDVILCLYILINGPCFTKIESNVIRTEFPETDSFYISKVKKFSMKMAKINPIGKDNRTLLHAALRARNGSNSKYQDDDMFNLPSIQLTELLLNSGFDVNWRDSNGDSCLMAAFEHGALYNDPEYDGWIGESRKVLNLLFDAHPHGDIRNKDGDTYMEIMPYMYMEDEFSDYQQINLQCLAAKAVADSGVPYEDYVPKNIVSFINMHHKNKFSVP